MSIYVHEKPTFPVSQGWVLIAGSNSSEIISEMSIFHKNDQWIIFC